MKDPTKAEIATGIGLLGLMCLVFVAGIGKARPWVLGLDEANLLIHESGHIFFGGGGELIAALGGTIMQIAFPAFAIAYFRFRRDLLGTMFGVFWLGQNLVNISVYIKDARTMLLPLVNGGTHDWNKILGMAGGLKYDTFLGNLVANTGWLIMAGAIGWCGYIVFEKLKQRAAKPLI